MKILPNCTGVGELNQVVCYLPVCIIDHLYRGTNTKHWHLLGKRIHQCKKRYLLLSKTKVCVGCGIEASEAALVTDGSKSGAIQLLAKKDDRVVIFTVDHILPKSKGGDTMKTENLQVMCNDCNWAKSDKTGSAGDRIDYEPPA